MAVEVQTSGHVLIDSGIVLIKMENTEADVLFKVPLRPTGEFVFRIVASTDVILPTALQSPSSTSISAIDKGEAVRMGVQLKKGTSYELCNFARLNRLEDPMAVYATVIIQPYYQYTDQWVVSYWFFTDATR